MAQSVQVVTEVENPEGSVLVQAVAHVDRQDDSHPLAGFYVRRRYHGDQFMIAAPEEFSPVWMRFVNDPPKEWRDKLGARLKKLQREETVDELKVDPNAPFSMTDLQEQNRRSAAMNYATGKVKSARVPR